MIKINKNELLNKNIIKNMIKNIINSKKTKIAKNLFSFKKKKIVIKIRKKLKYTKTFRNIK